MTEWKHNGPYMDYAPGVGKVTRPGRIYWHAWRQDGKTFRWVGRFASKDKAKQAIENGD